MSLWAICVNFNTLVIKLLFVIFYFTTMFNISIKLQDISENGPKYLTSLLSHKVDILVKKYLNILFSTFNSVLFSFTQTSNTLSTSLELKHYCDPCTTISSRERMFKQNARDRNNSSIFYITALIYLPIIFRPLTAPAHTKTCTSATCSPRKEGSLTIMKWEVHEWKWLS